MPALLFQPRTIRTGFNAKTPRRKAAKFFETIEKFEDFRVFHFGDYDTTALKHIKARLSEARRTQIDAILGKCTNVLTALYPHIYFPAYSNSLKDIGRLLGDDYPTNETTGLHSIIWRSEWEAQPKIALKVKLIDYNRTDCALLNRLSDSMVRQTSADGSKEAGLSSAQSDPPANLTPDAMPPNGDQSA